ncbi:MAG: NHLP leader peptide family RiPP precursor [Planctomycetota bacterium]|nr:NHLP leader peptide family RiPP precursor [Planctomycetota bacterium]
MTEQGDQLADLFAACWKDEALNARLMSDPKAVLKEHGLDVPDNLDVKVMENADDCVHITLPAPPSGFLDLSNDELRTAAAAGLVAGHGPVRFTRGPADC